jgi:hypothetical protein
MPASFAQAFTMCQMTFSVMPFSRRLPPLSIDGVEGTYRTAYTDCRLEKNRFPPAAAIQQLVAAWKVLRKSRKR